MTLCEHYLIAESIDDTLRILGDVPGSVRIVAGGTDLIVDLQQGREKPVDTLIDITQIPELQVIEIRKSEIYIGACVTHAAVSSSTLIRENAEALAIACGLVGSPQVRNQGTLGGNVAHALPAADGTIALLALGADAEICSASGKRRIHLPDLFAGPGRTHLNKRKEILTGFYIPMKQPGSGSAFNRVMRPQGVAIAILNAAVWLAHSGHLVTDIRIAVAPSGPVPRRMTATEKFLKGKVLTDGNIEEAKRFLLDEAVFRSSKHRASQEYRRKVASSLFEETLVQAWKNAARRTQ